MGCDIHMHAEILGDDDKWHHYDIIRFPRYYLAFTALAGVRGKDDKCLFPIKALPSDMDYTTRSDMENVDYHSHNWLTWEEFGRFCDWAKDNLSPDTHHAYWDFECVTNSFLFGNSYHPKFEEDNVKLFKDVRFIFAFDN